MLSCCIKITVFLFYRIHGFQIPAILMVLSKKQTTLTFLLFFIFLLGGQSALAQKNTQQEKRILVLHSMESNRPLQVYFNKYLRDAMGVQSSHPYVIDFENLDLIRYPGRNYKQNLIKILRQKYSNPLPDILITVLPQATVFVNENNLFPDVPKIFITAQPTMAESPFTRNNSVIGHFGTDFKSNVEHCLELFPNTKKVYVVRGDGIIGKNWEQAFNEDTKNLRNRISFEYLRSLDVDELMNRAQSLPEHSIIYYLVYTKDPLNRSVYAMDIGKKLGEHANRPVFAFMDMFTETGILGGKVISIESLAIWASEITWRVFNGEDIDIFEDYHFKNKHIYNWDQLIKWKIDENNLPPNSIIQNRIYSFFDLYKWHVYGGVLLLLAESLFILILVVNINRRRKAEETLKISHKTLEESEERFRNTFEQAAVGIAHVAPDGKFLRVNNKFCNIIGYTQKDISERTFQDFTHPADLDTDLKNVNQILDKAIQTYSREKRYLHKNGSIVWINLTVNLLRELDGKPKYFIGIVEDISQRKQAEERIKSSLKEKETLLHEIHHRVKNNMQVINSLLNLQSNNIQDQHVKSILKDSQSRVYAMSAIHESLHGSERLSEINLMNYLTKITTSIFQTYATDHQKVKLNNNVEEVPISLNQAYPLGLTINELISNSLKYAFPDERKGEINVNLKELDKKVELTVMDDGIGIPDGLDWKNSKSLGLKLIRTLVENQLDGSIDLDNTNGTKFTIKFNIEK
jgi:PAS domain S-box-containing protein